MPLGNWMSLLAALAALAGAAGVSEAAFAAHGSTDPLLQTSSQFLLFHAAAVIGITAFSRSAGPHSKPIFLAGALLMFGTIVFCSDLSARALTGSKLFTFAAPIGGTAMIAAWLCVSISTVLSLRKPYTP